MRGTAKYLTFLPILLGTSLLIISCSKKETPTEITDKNHPAKIISLTATPDTIPQGQTTIVECIATDEDGDSLRIWWEARKLAAGNNNGAKITMGTWKGEQAGGDDTINVFVSDNKVITKGRLPVHIGALPIGPPIVSPPNAQKDVEPSPMLIWRKSNAESYTLQVAKDEGFTSLIINESNLKDTTKQLYKLELDKYYFWRIKPKNKYGESDWNGRFYFVTPRGPIVPLLSTPEKNRTIPPWLVKFSWNALDDFYCLQISENPNFTTMVYNKNDLTNTSAVLPHLTQGTQYYWRVSSTNKYGTSPYSDVNSFKVANIGNANPTSCGNTTYVEYQGKKYNIVQIGTQCWFKENLNVGRFTSYYNKQTDNGFFEKYCYNDDENNCDILGGLYLWEEAVSYKRVFKAKGLCPDGWHIPTTYEFWILDDYVKGDSNDLKAVGQGTGDGKGNNSSGFSALFAGYFWSVNNTFQSLNYSTNFWTSGDEINGFPAATQSIGSTHNEIKDDYGDYYRGYYGYSVRCIKD